MKGTSMRNVASLLVAGVLVAAAAVAQAPVPTEAWSREALELGDALEIAAVTLRMEQFGGRISASERTTRLAALARSWAQSPPTQREADDWLRRFDTALPDVIERVESLAIAGRTDAGYVVREVGAARVSLARQRGAAGDLAAPLAEVARLLLVGRPESQAFDGIDAELDAVLESALAGVVAAAIPVARGASAPGPSVTGLAATGFAATGPAAPLPIAPRHGDPPRPPTTFHPIAAPMTLEWVGQGADRCGPTGFAADGQADGELVLTHPFTDRLILMINLTALDGAGQPCCATWSTGDARFPFLGASAMDGQPTNAVGYTQVYGQPPGRLRLHATGADWFTPARAFLETIVLTDGGYAGATVIIGGGPAGQTRADGALPPLPPLARGGALPAGPAPWFGMPPGAGPAPVAGGALQLDLRWAGKGADRVGGGWSPAPDGQADAEFDLTIPGLAQPIKSLALCSADAQWQASVHRWTSTRDGSWILGVSTGGGGLVNADTSLRGLGGASWPVRLSVADPGGAFEQGSRVMLDVVLDDGSKLTTGIVIGSVSRPSDIGSMSRPSDIGSMSRPSDVGSMSRPSDIVDGPSRRAFLGWIGLSADRVSPGAAAVPDGVPDGVLVVNTAALGRVVTSLEIYTVDAAGERCCGQVWSTAQSGSWILGIAPRGGAVLLSAQVPQLGQLPDLLDLFAADSGTFRSGQGMGLSVTLADGSVQRALTVIP